MSIPPFISKKLRESLGQDAGDGLVTWLREMRTEHEEKLAEMRAERQADAAELRHQIASLIQASESRLTERIHGLDVRMTALEGRIERDDRFGKLEVQVAEVKADLMKWSFVFWVGAIAAIAMLAEVLP